MTILGIYRVVVFQKIVEIEAIKTGEVTIGQSDIYDIPPNLKVKPFTFTVYDKIEDSLLK